MSRWSVEIALVVTSDDAVLLARRRGEARWSVPRTELLPVEDPEAAARALGQSTFGFELPWVGLTGVQVRGEPSPTLVLVYHAEAPGYPDVRDEVEEARFFQVEHLPALSEADRDLVYRAVTGG